ncbi:MAG: DUF302 domain-containing protein [Chloroflexi bacterium]|nr:DUF302 domain-containing protein [Chloroflexota bacterium]
MLSTTPYGIKVKTSLDFGPATEAIIDALSVEGFGILTRIDVTETLKTKLDVEIRPYVILGACNPSLAHRGLQIEPDLGLLLPCNVIVYEEAGGAVVAAMEPALMATITGNPGMNEIAEEARTHIVNALESLAAASD